MSKNGGAAADKQPHTRDKTEEVTEKPKVSTISFSLPQVTVRAIARVKKWEEKSESRALELSGRR